MIASKGEVYLLGTDSIHGCKINTWQERVNIALSNGHQSALNLALTFYNGTAKAVIGELDFKFTH